MGLPRALKAHQEGELDLAEKHYKRALTQDDSNPVIYQNYGSLLRTLQRLDEAESLYCKGLSLHPDHLGINSNLANLLRKSKPASAVERYIYVFKIRLTNGESIVSEKIATILNDIIGILRENGLHAWALHLLDKILPHFTENPNLLVNLLLVIDACKLKSDVNDFLDLLYESVLSHVDVVEPFSRLEILFGLATHHLMNDNVIHASNYYDKAFSCGNSLLNNKSEKSDEVRKLITVNGWNMGCTMLKLQYFSQGWKLFEHGLQTPCDGKQRWQRALSKPFSSDEVHLWRGESLEGKSILLLDEQAIGDVMMFATLLKVILNEARQVSLFLNDRLLSIYKRSYSKYILEGKLLIYSKSDYTSGNLIPFSFDYQCPIGSICQHRFVSPHSYAPLVPCLTADSSVTSKLRERYLGSAKDLRLIGVSWRGGGKAARMKQKSIDEDLFCTLLSSLTGCRFVSLQYGKCDKSISNWLNKGLDVIYDECVNPLKDMDMWLSQVAACDAVISVANTTIHGAGGLNIPTHCLLSRYADWRWLDSASVTRSYWYPSVGIARQSKDLSWDNAIKILQLWAQKGFPFPSGDQYLAT